MSQPSLTFVCTQSSRGDAERAPFRTTITETVFASGEVHVVATGFGEDGVINQRAVRPSRGPVDLAVVKAARVSGGWRVVS